MLRVITTPEFDSSWETADFFQLPVPYRLLLEPDFRPRFHSPYIVAALATIAEQNTSVDVQVMRLTGVFSATVIGRRVIVMTMIKKPIQNRKIS